MTVPILQNPKPQFSDANGKPYVGGLLYTYVKGTTTPKQTWQDPDQAAVNTNPITLDAAGECSMWGDGDYRLILNDALGNLIWDQPSTSLASAAMYPVVTAPTTDDAMNYLGVTAAIAAEATARHDEIVAVQGTLQTNIDNEANDRTLADNNIINYATSAVADLQAYDTSLTAAINAISGAPVNVMQAGAANLGASGAVTVNFPTAFLSGCDAVICMLSDAAPVNSGIYGSVTFVCTSKSASSATITAYGPGNAAITSPPLTLPAPFYWIAVGH